jgi:hypothetical protein
VIESCHNVFVEFDNFVDHQVNISICDFVRDNFVHHQFNTSVCDFVRTTVLSVRCTGIECNKAAMEKYRRATKAQCRWALDNPLEVLVEIGFTYVCS